LFDSKEFERWILQARDTLESANEDLNNGRYNWACFKAQQAAEYAVKGLIYGLGSIPTGHSVLRLLARLRGRRIDVEGVMRYARILDRHYIPTRYPNAHPEGPPYEYYDELTAREALEAARKILETMEMEGERRRVEASDTL
jgi:HEPN domain-containing protein